MPKVEYLQLRGPVGTVTQSILGPQQTNHHAPAQIGLNGKFCANFFFLQFLGLYQIGIGMFFQQVIVTTQSYLYQLQLNTPNQQMDSTDMQEVVDNLPDDDVCMTESSMTLDLPTKAVM